MAWHIFILAWLVLFRPQIGNANPSNEKAQARVYALWTFAKAYVADKDRVAIHGGKGAEIKVCCVLVCCVLCTVVLYAVGHKA